MESSRFKRRRLMASSYISSLQRPNDLPAIFESLNDDTKRLILQLVGNKSYATYAGINKHCKDIYLTTEGMTKETFLYGYAPLSRITNQIEITTRDQATLSPFNTYLETVSKGVVLYNRGDVLNWAIQERTSSLLKEICNLAAEEGRIGLLNKVLNHMNDEDRNIYIFGLVYVNAARGGKLDVLKWVELKGLSIYKGMCAELAACSGHIHILKWLREEKGLKLKRQLYYSAIDGGHLHVMKWLREQGVRWHGWTFGNASCGGHLDILQWLHDEGCPWPDDVDYCVCERDLKPEVVDWCCINGYRDRIFVRH